MENLRIDFHLTTPAILNRFTTIDGILLKTYFDLNPPSSWIEPTPDCIKFIHSEYGVFSGSIWYAGTNGEILRNQVSLVKKIDADKYIKWTDGTSAINPGSGQYKSYQIAYETIFTSHIYFYIKGDRKIISEITDNIIAIGKKQSVGYGKVDKINITEIDKDKGFMLSHGNPSRPLTIVFARAKTGRVAYYRPIPPYYLKKDRYICYMPCSSLYELTDPPFIDNNKIFHPINLSASEFACKAMELDTNHLPESKLHICGACGKASRNTISIKEALKKHPGFNDYPYIKGEYICNYCLSVMKMENMRKSENRYIDETKTIKLIGKNGIGKEDRDEFVRNLDKVIPPYFISIKSIRNNQHVVWKGVVGISNAIVPIQYGNNTMHVDTAMLKQAIADMDAGKFRKISAINSAYPYITSDERKYIGKYDDAVLRMLQYVIPRTGENL